MLEAISQNDNATGRGLLRQAGGHVSERTSPDRKCIVTGEIRQQDELVRFALGPDNLVAPDLLKKLGGYGVWITADRTMIQTAVEKGLFARAFRQKVILPQDLPDLIDRQLEQSALDAIGMARKSGSIVTGFEGLVAKIRAGKIGLVIHASDGADDGLRKITAAWTASASDEPIPLVRLFTAARISLALGLENVVHAGLPLGGMSGAVMEKCQRLVDYRAL